MSALAFHEKAGRCQPVFCAVWDKFISFPGLNTIPCTPSCRFCRHPSIRTLSELSIARCKLGVLDSAGAATCYCDLSLDLADGVLGQANDAVTGTRLMTQNLHTSGTELCNRRQCSPTTWS
jgi:hypothetical protein